MFPIKKVFIFLLLCCVGGVFLTGCLADEPEPSFSRTELLLDTYCTITLGGTDDETLLDGAFDICRELDALFSITDSSSDVWLINHAGGEPVTVDRHTIRVIKQGLEFGSLSGGEFDISIGRLSRLWDFGSGHSTVPGESDISEAVQTVGYEQVLIAGTEAAANNAVLCGAAAVDTVLLTNPDTWIDLGGIAKGYIADEIVRYLNYHEVPSALIDLGGDIYALGARGDGNPWRIGVRRPFGSMEEYIGVLEVTDAAVVSSGVYERQFEADGVLYHHILSPQTGMPAQTDVVSATILSDRAIIGEGLSTMAVLIGSADIQAIFGKTPGFIGAVLVLDGGDVLMFGDVNLVTG